MHEVLPRYPRPSEDDDREDGERGEGVEVDHDVTSARSAFSVAKSKPGWNPPIVASPGRIAYISSTIASTQLQSP